MTFQNNKTNHSSSPAGGRATLRDIIAKPIQKIRAGSGVESKKVTLYRVSCFPHEVREKELVNSS